MSMTPIGLEGVEGGIMAIADLRECVFHTESNAFGHDLASVLRDENNMSM